MDLGIPPLVLAGTDPNNTLHLFRGDVGAGLFGKACHLETIRQHWITSALNDCRLELGPDFQAGTTPDFKIMGGQAIIEAGAGLTLEAIGSTCFLRGGTYTSVTAGRNSQSGIDGKVFFENASSLTTIELFKGGYANFNALTSGKTVTTFKMHEGSTYVDERGVLTLSNGIAPQGCGIGDVAKHRPIGEAWNTV